VATIKKVAATRRTGLENPCRAKRVGNLLARSWAVRVPWLLVIVRVWRIQSNVSLLVLDVELCWIAKSMMRVTDEAESSKAATQFFGKSRIEIAMTSETTVAVTTSATAGRTV
jgi:hypothetical protein